ncbi:MAG TPA: family 2 encapsulin nanocompartment cargo protein polyprenyl transferase [Pseudonocardiaceae bacterium]|jgi:geranylgeranyl diphosphate synthase type I
MTAIEVMTMGRSARDTLAWSDEVVVPAMRSAIGALPDSMRHIIGYHFGWLDEHDRPTQTDGVKAIRPALVMLSAEAAGGAPGAAVPAAVAVELVHNFSLLHDDVMDGDATRRHRPTAWRAFGRSASILAGDALLSLAFDVLAGSNDPVARDNMRMLSAAVLALVDGHLADLAFEKRYDVDMSECMRMTHNKTAALLGCACAMGALSGGGNPDQMDHLRVFGERLGLAFQHIDDLLGIWGDPVVTGKAIYSDLRSRKKSFPVVAALTSGTPAGRELGALYHASKPLSAPDLVRAAQLIDLAGGRAWSQAQADELLAHALHQLSLATPKARAGTELGELARLATCRDH